LTTEFCVKSTALDAVEKGYQTIVISNATTGIKSDPGDEKQAYREMEKAGVKIIYKRTMESKT
jgi:nicotinamidase/pyrazinamidase